MASFERRYPNKGIRQPRIQYRVDDPRMAPLEDLRELGGFRNMNNLYLQALLIGAERLLAQARDQGFELSGETTPTLPPDEKFVLPVPPRVAVLPPGSGSVMAFVEATSVIDESGGSDSEKVPDKKLSLVVEPMLGVPPLELPQQGILLRPSSAAADA